MVNLSSAMGGQFAWSAAEMTAEIQRIGPNPLRQDGPQGEEVAQKSQRGPEHENRQTGENASAMGDGQAGGG
jgi:hypothetical protein